MDTLLATVAAIAVIGVGIALLSKLWPSSYTKVGYRLGSHETPEAGAKARENDDEGRWGWK